MAEYDDIILTEEEKEAIKQNAPDKMPINPTAMGWTAQQIRNKTSAFVTGTTKSILKLFEDKNTIVKGHFDTNRIKTLNFETFLSNSFGHIENGEKLYKVEFYNGLGTISSSLTFDGTRLIMTLGGVEYLLALTKGGNVFDDEQTFNGNVFIKGVLDMFSQKITNLQAGVNDGDAVNKAQLDTKEDSSNKVIEFQATPTDEAYISEKLAKDSLDLKVPKVTTIMSIDLQNNITRVEVLDALLEATEIDRGYMSAIDKQRLNALHALLGEGGDGDAFVNTINEVLAIFNSYPEGTNLLNWLNDKVDKIVGKGLSTNDLTDVLKDHYDSAYTHSRVTDSNPHATKFNDLLVKPITLAGFGIGDAYDKDYINALEDYNGWQSTLLTPTALVSTDTILTATLAAKDKLTFICKNLTTGEIDTDELVGSSIVTGAKLVFFDNAAVYFTVGATDSTFTEDGTYELTIVGFNVETQNAVDVDYDNTDSGLVGTNVKVAIDEV
ncbi:MAG: hypothetical protein PF513_03170, partial [Tenericutes bacterium]|nr:hypothetical protein [Mycoplasmatota bacterium]